MEPALYDKLVYKLGSLHSLLREISNGDLYQGEHTLVFTGADGAAQTVHIYIDGTDLQMSATEGSPGINLSAAAFGD
jgi:VCBS repeat-containing protein